MSEYVRITRALGWALTVSLLVLVSLASVTKAEPCGTEHKPCEMVSQR